MSDEKTFCYVIFLMNFHVKKKKNSKIIEPRKKNKETKGREKTFTENDKQEQIRRQKA